MFNFLFVLLMGATGVVIGYRLWHILMAMAEQSIRIQEATGREWDDVFSEVNDELKEVNKVTVNWLEKLSPERAEKYKATTNLSSALVVSVIVLAPIYAIISILMLIF